MSDSSSSALSDADLLVRHLGGDSAAFAELIERHRDRMWAVALRTLGDPEEAADALQDAMISAFRQAGRFRADVQLSTWLHRIVVNACLDRIRRKQARPTVPLPESRLRELVAPRDAMSDRETRLAVQDALDQLPEEQRIVVKMVDLEGYSVAETARLLGIAEGTVKSRAARARAKLAKSLSYLRHPQASARRAPFRSDTAADEQAPRVDVVQRWLDGLPGGTTPSVDAVQESSARLNAGLQRLFLALGPPPADLPRTERQPFVEYAARATTTRDEDDRGTASDE